jgi:hypothetical protein
LCSLRGPPQPEKLHTRLKPDPGVVNWYFRTRLYYPLIARHRAEKVSGTTEITTVHEVKQKLNLFTKKAVKDHPSKGGNK